MQDYNCNNSIGCHEDFLRVRGISKSFNSSSAHLEILRDIDFDLGKGETMSIVGASGIGKSTLLHILGTLDYPDSGTISFINEDIFSYDSDKLAKFRNESIGFVFQFHHLLPEFAAVENIMMPELIKGTSKKKAKEKAEEILIRVGLKDRINSRVSVLSGGEQQRVAIARALILKPLILLADEPTGNLDKRNSEQVHELLMELNRELGMSMIVVTHNMELASFMARCVTLIDGRLVDAG
ncbi:MAG: ABC transporter ATP-binding protein [Desulfobacterium sp.]|nr:ABC transporter ATP-binding protein [Desulfobacterium sp.]MBU3947053.1 ABC transporter ATP-binding protein [Pseudomonadota bacterium]MBU4011324.1 ABC transporter ATP-binding protein [Pseudomonadota bacterium]MBU4037240.1 ABC transporter ATP-binding protein [Pseudomonadota bacterium]